MLIEEFNYKLELYRNDLLKNHQEIYMLPLDFFENSDLNSEFLNGVPLAGGATLAMVMAMKFDFFNMPSMLVTILKAYPDQIKTLDWNKKLSNEIEAGLTLSLMLFKDAPALAKQILRQDPLRAKMLDIKANLVNPNHPAYGTDLTWIAVCLQYDFTLIDDLLSMHPPHMASINMNAKPLNKTHYLFNSNFSVVWGLLLHKPDLFDKILAYHPPHLKALQLDAELTLPDSPKQTFSSTLFIKGKVRVIFDIMQETDQKISVQDTEILAALYAYCQSLNDIYTLMRNYTEEEFASLLHKPETQDLSHICLFYSLELDINTLYEDFTESPEPSLPLITSLLSKAADAMEHFSKIKNSLYKEAHIPKIFPLLSLIKALYNQYSEHPQIKLNKLISPFLPRLLPNVYTASSSFHSPQDLPLPLQIDFEILRHLAGSPKFSIEFENCLISALKKDAPSPPLRSKTAHAFHTELVTTQKITTEQNCSIS